MPTHAVTDTGTAARRNPSRRLGGVLVALAVAGCAAGGLPTTTSSPPALPSPPAVATPAPAGADAGTPEPALQPTPDGSAPAGPPAASLAGVAGPAAAGALGSFVWGGTGSDAPWLVPPAHRAVPGPGPFVVTFAPPLEVSSWRAAWAPVMAGQAGNPAGAEAGRGGPVVVGGPDRPGTWSLLVEARFAGGDHAAWYWRVVLP